jgi:tRNA(fMet)-specific endonuclease VapC
VKLEKRGISIGPYDILIAASALSNNWTLVTHNREEFERIDGLKIEDWY